MVYLRCLGAGKRRLIKILLAAVLLPAGGIWGPKCDAWASRSEGGLGLRSKTDRRQRAEQRAALVMQYANKMISPLIVRWREAPIFPWGFSEGKYFLELWLTCFGCPSANK